MADERKGLIADRPLKIADDGYTVVEAHADRGRQDLVTTQGGFISAEDAEKYHLITENDRIRQVPEGEWTHMAAPQPGAPAPQAPTPTPPTPTPQPPRSPSPAKQPAKRGGPTKNAGKKRK